jgi:hypothetical protein
VMTYITPPDGWFTYGSHIEYSAPLEFSEELDSDGLPLFERPVAKKYTPFEVGEIMLKQLGDEIPEHERSWFAGQIERAIYLYEDGE